MEVLWTLAVLTAFWTVQTAQEIEMTYEEFKKVYRKQYTSCEDEMFRRMVFLSNLERINAHNHRSDATFRMSLNWFGDFTHDEFSKYLAARGSLFEDEEIVESLPIDELEMSSASPESIDFSRSNCTGGVRNQGPCGSCWAFAAIEAAEYHYCHHKNNNRYRAFSKQQLIDCSFKDKGCRHGWTMNALQYIVERGVTTETVWPYAASEGACVYASVRPLILRPIESFGRVPRDEQSMRAALAAFGPIVVTIDASQLQFYGGGIISGQDCNCTSAINHAVNVVGFDSEDGVSYWKLKNIWGTRWGEDGYFRMAADVETKDGCLCLIKSPFYVK